MAEVDGLDVHIPPQLHVRFEVAPKSQPVPVAGRIEDGWLVISIVEGCHVTAELVDSLQKIVWTHHTP